MIETLEELSWKSNLLQAHEALLQLLANYDQLTLSIHHPSQCAMCSSFASHKAIAVTHRWVPAISFTGCKLDNVSV
jgi:hypothetical protein